MQEIFNKKLDKIIMGLPRVVKSTDDFVVTGKDMAEHDECLRGLLTRSQIMELPSTQPNANSAKPK